MNNWSKDEAIALCTIIEQVVPPCGCHVALTGGCLYKDGPRKDLDLLFYRIRQVDEIDKQALFSVLANLGLVVESGFAWCHKGTWKGKQVDLFFPEEDGEHNSGESDKDDEVVIPVER